MAVLIVSGVVGAKLTGPSGDRSPLAPSKATSDLLVAGATPAQYVGHIVHWSDESKVQKTAWLVVIDHGVMRRRWIPDTATFWCLKNRGAPGPDELSSAQLDAMPDQPGVWADCAGSAARRSNCSRSKAKRGGGTTGA